jgi:hypothetical protein
MGATIHLFGDIIRTLNGNRQPALVWRDARMMIFRECTATVSFLIGAPGSGVVECAEAVDGATPGLEHVATRELRNKVLNDWHAE